MKQRAVWSAVLVAALALAGCGSATDTRSSPGGADGKLVVWDWKSGEATAGAYLQKAKADFAKKHPDVTVEFVAQPFEQYYTLLGTAIQAGKGPDVILFNGGGQIRDRVDALLPLDEYVAEDRQRLAGWEAFSKDGKTYAGPVTLQGHPIYYNKTLYEKAGLDPANPAKTWPEFVANCATITKQTGAKCFALGNKEGFGIQFFLSAFGTGVSHPAGAGRLDRRQAGLELPARQADLRALEGDPGREAEQRRGELDGDVQRLLRDLPVRQGRPRHRADVGHRALEGLQRVRHRREAGRDAGPGRRARRHAEPAVRRRHRLRRSPSGPRTRGGRRPGALVDLDRRAEVASTPTPGRSPPTPPSTSPRAARRSPPSSPTSRAGKPALHVALSSKTLELMGRLSQRLLSGSITVDEAVKQLAASDQAG